MRRVTWTVLGLLGLSLLLCGAEAQAQQVDPAAQAEIGVAGASTVELQQGVLQLQAEVARLRQEVARLRAELANVSATVGVGGAGQAGGAQPATQPGGAQPVAPPGTTVPGEAVVNAIYTGTVSSVSQGRLQLLDDGQVLTLELGERTRVYRDGRSISVGQLEEGTRVRVTVDLVGLDNEATEISVLPPER